MLRNYDVEPYFVFDGDALPTKSATEKSRHASRFAAKQRGLELYHQGKSREAFDQFQKCVDITPLMAATVIELLKRHGIRYVVAPYEADAQLVYLEQHHHIQAIISEDSDLLVFGAQRLLTKMDNIGNFVEVARDRFHLCSDFDLSIFSPAEIRTMVILQGCDYSPGIPGIGSKKSYLIVRKHRAYNKIMKHLRLQGTFKIPPNFDDIYKQATTAFQHQRVFCPEKLKMVMLNELSSDPADESFNMDQYIGHEKPLEISREIALGKIHPTTYEPLIVPTLPAFKMDTWPKSASHTFGNYISPKTAKSFSYNSPSRAPLHERTTAESMNHKSSKRKFERLMGSSDDEIDESVSSNYFGAAKAQSEATPSKIPRMSTSNCTPKIFMVGKENRQPESLDSVATSKSCSFASMQQTENISSPENSPPTAKKNSVKSLDRLSKFAFSSPTNRSTRSPNTVNRNTPSGDVSRPSVTLKDFFAFRSSPRAN